MKNYYVYSLAAIIILGLAIFGFFRTEQTRSVNAKIELPFQTDKLFAIEFINDTEGFLLTQNIDANDKAVVAKTANAGKTWQLLDSIPETFTKADGYYKTLTKIDEQQLYLFEGLHTGLRVFYSDDAAQSWQEKHEMQDNTRVLAHRVWPDGSYILITREKIHHSQSGKPPRSIFFAKPYQVT